MNDDQSAVRVHATEYTVSVLPEGHIDGIVFDLSVMATGRGQWAVRLRRGNGQCLNSRGRWDEEPIPSSRTEKWLESHRFDLDTALSLASKHAPEVWCNGITAADRARELASKDDR